MSDNNPRLFVSYSWTTPDHEAWVLNLATELRDNGVEVTLDKWDLREGHDSYAFMEKMVSDPEIRKVALICDRVYAEKADGRNGGVGTETQIISPEIYSQQDQNKFVAIVVERDPGGKAYLPTYYKSRIYIDLSSPDLYASNFEQLLRWLFDKPLHVKPELGNKPKFLEDDGHSISLGTSTQARRALEGIRNNRDYWPGALVEYFDTFAQNLERLRLSKSDAEFDDQVVESIEAFLPIRNELIEVFFALAQYQDNEDTRRLTHRFFEQLLPYMNRPESVNRWSDGDFDNFRFIVHELVLYEVAILLKYERFVSVGHFLRHDFYLGTNEYRESNGMAPFSAFCDTSRSFEHRNIRLKLNRLSLQADLLEKRSHNSGLQFCQLMQADFLIYMRDCLECSRADRLQIWWPITLVYLGRQSTAFEVFARAQSKEYFDRLCGAFDVQKKEDFAPMFAAFDEGRLRAPNWSHVTFVNPPALFAFEQLASRP